PGGRGRGCLPMRDHGRRVRAVPIEPTRRKVLTVAGLASLAAVATACTGGSSNNTGSASPSGSSSSGTPAPGTSAPGSPSPSATTAAPTLAALQRKLFGRLALPGHSSYRPAALLYNPRFAGQAKPKAIARCASPADV